MRSTAFKFPDTANINNYIENQKLNKQLKLRAFERHKKQLDKIYSRLNYKSAVELGITDNSAFKLLEDKKQQLNKLQRFYLKGIMNKQNEKIISNYYWYQHSGIKSLK